MSGWSNIGVGSSTLLVSGGGFVFVASSGSFTFVAGMGTISAMCPAIMLVESSDGAWARVGSLRCAEGNGELFLERNELCSERGIGGSEALDGGLVRGSGSGEIGDSSNGVSLMVGCFQDVVGLKTTSLGCLR